MASPVNSVHIIDNSKYFKDALPIQIERALVSVGMRAERYAKERCPVDTGRLRNSITYATAKTQSKGNDMGGAKASAEDMKQLATAEDNSVYIGTNVEYAERIELGGSKQAPKGFLRPAAYEHGEEYRELVKKALKDE